MNVAQRGLSQIQGWIARGAVRRRLWMRAVFAFGRVHNPFQRPLLTPDDVLQVEAIVRPGDVLSAYTRRYASSAMIPGRYKHTAIYAGHGYIIHAVAPCVSKMRLVDFLRDYDRVAVWRPKYGHGNWDAWKTLDRAAFLSLGTAYDPFFADGNDLWYCHEFVAHCLGRAGLIVPKRGPQILADDIKVVCDEILEVGQ